MPFNTVEPGISVEAEERSATQLFLLVMETAVLERSLVVRQHFKVLSYILHLFSTFCKPLLPITLATEIFQHHITEAPFVKCSGPVSA